MIRTGFAIRDITAPVGAEMPGSFVRRVNQGVLDSLLVTAAVIDDGVQAIAVVGVDDPHGRSLAADLERRPGWRVVPISVRERLSEGVSVIDGRLFDAPSAEAIGDLRPIETLPGAHNWQNAAAAYAVGRALGMEAAAIMERMASFAGLAHRQDNVQPYLGKQGAPLDVGRTFLMLDGGPFRVP